MTARLGPQIELVQKLFTKTIPSFANLSITGVGLIDFNHPLYAAAYKLGRTIIQEQ